MKDHAGLISALLTVAVILCGLIAKFVALDEWMGTSRTQIADHERRISAIERDKSTHDAINELQKQIQLLNWKFDNQHEQFEQLLEKKHGR